MEAHCLNKRTETHFRHPAEIRGSPSPGGFGGSKADGFQPAAGSPSAGEIFAHRRPDASTHRYRGFRTRGAVSVFVDLLWLSWDGRSVSVQRQSRISSMFLQ